MSDVTADRVVVELEARMGDYNAQLLGGAQTFDRSMKSVRDSATQTERVVSHSFDNTRISQQILMHVARSTADSFASGTPPMQIFAQHLAQVAEAGAYAGGSLGKVGEFLGGPWGIAITAAVSVLSTLIASEYAASTAATDHRTAEEKLRDAIVQLNHTITERLNVNLDAIESEHRMATAQLATAEATRAQTRALLEQALVRAQAEQQSSTDPTTAGEGGFNPGSQGVNTNRVGELQRELARLDADVAGAAQNVANANVDRQRNTITHVDRENLLYQALQHNVEVYYRRATAAGQTAENLARANELLLVTERALNTAHERRLQLAQQLDAAERGTVGGPGSTRFGLPVQGTITGRFGDHRSARDGVGEHNHAGVDIAVPVGTQVHAAAAGTIIEAGNIPGYGYTIVIDHGGGTTSRYAHLSQYLQRSGHVEAGQVIALSGGARGSPGAGDATGPHLHYEVRQGGRPVNPLAGTYNTDPLAADNAAHRQTDAAARAAERVVHEQERAARDLQAFNDEKARLDAALLQAQGRAAVDLDRAEQFQRDQITVARDRKDADYLSLVQQHHLTAAQAAQLKALNDQVATAQLAAIERDHQARLAREATAAAQRQLQISTGDFSNQRDLLHGQEDLATTSAERRDIELRLLDLQYQEERARLQSVIAANERMQIDTSATAEAKAAAATDAEIARRRLEVLGQVEAYARSATLRSTASPGQAYLQTLNAARTNVHDSIESAAVDGLHNLNQGLADAITGAKSLGEVFHNVAMQIVADLLRIAIQRELIQPLANALFGGGSKSSGSGGIFSFLTNILGTAASSGGGGKGAFDFGSFMKDTFSVMPGKASGGNISAGQLYRVNETGIEGFRPAQSGQIIPLGRMNKASEGGAAAAPAVVRVLVGANDYFDVRVQHVSGTVAVETIRAAQPALTDHAVNETFRRAQRPGL